MTLTFITLSPTLTLISLVAAVIQRRHLLMALLALEASILSLVMLIMLTNHPQWGMLVLVMLTFGACGASLGLACMVAMARSFGNDHMTSLSLNKC